MRDYIFSQSLAEFHRADANTEIILNFLISHSCLIAMASSSKRARVAESDSEDSDSPFEMAEEITGGLESGEESEIDRLLENESGLSR